MFAASATTTASVERKHSRSLLLQDRRHKMTEENFRKECLPRAVVLVEGDIKKRAESVREEISKTVQSQHKWDCTNPSCDCWHPPACQNFKTESGCNFGEKCVCKHAEVDSQPSKKLKKSGGQGSLAWLKNSKQLGCVFQDVRPPKSKSFLRKSKKSMGPKRTIQFSKRTLHHVKNAEKKGTIARTYSEVRTLRAQSLCSKIRG